MREECVACAWLPLALECVRGRVDCVGSALRNRTVCSRGVLGLCRCGDEGWESTTDVERYEGRWAAVSQSTSDKREKHVAHGREQTRPSHAVNP